MDARERTAPRLQVPVRRASPDATAKQDPTEYVDLDEPSVRVPALSRLLLDAKYSPPRVHPDFISRPELVAKARGSGRRLIAVQAPAGYGKSTFLAEWAAAEDRRVAWVSLDPFDDDPVNLLRSLASALWRAGLGSPELVLDAPGQGVSVLGRAAPRLAAEMRTCPHAFLLALDDLQELQCSTCQDVLGLVISAIPPGSQLAAASRSVQPRLPRLRAASDALELGPDDLRLDETATQQIFLNAHVAVRPEVAAAVTERAEGWPVGLSLATLIAKEGCGDQKAISGDDRYVADYLRREALARQPRTIQRFLRRTAILDQLCAPLCEAVLRSAAAAGNLRFVAEQGLFVTPLDREREWYRYHPLFREFLLAELRHTEPGVVPSLHERAADWYEANGSAPLAVEHLLHTPQRDRTTRLVAKLAWPTFMAGQLSTVQRWCGTLGDAAIESYPPLAVYRCWESVLTGDIAGAAWWSAFVDAASFDSKPADGSASFESARAMLRAGTCADGPEAMLTNATVAVNQEPTWSPYHDKALWLLAEANLLSGRLDEARAAFAKAATMACAMNNFDNVPICESHLAWMAMDRNEWEEAAERLEIALRTISERRLHDYVFSIPTFVAAARLALHHSDPHEAHRQLTRAMRGRPSATHLLPYHAVRLRLQLAKVYLAMTDLSTARQLLREIDGILKERPSVGVLVDEVAAFRDVVECSTSTGGVGTLPLTPAELRLLPYLQTHLTADKIAERLSISGHTVKTQVKSIYRKLGVTSRNDAVQTATNTGLLGG